MLPSSGPRWLAVLLQRLAAWIKNTAGFEFSLSSDPCARPGGERRRTTMGAPGRCWESRRVPRGRCGYRCTRAGISALGSHGSAVGVAVDLCRCARVPRGVPLGAPWVLQPTRRTWGRSPRSGPNLTAFKT